jgi:hypothetical protein
LPFISKTLYSSAHFLGCKSCPQAPLLTFLLFTRPLLLAADHPFGFDVSSLLFCSLPLFFHTLFVRRSIIFLTAPLPTSDSSAHFGLLLFQFVEVLTHHSLA